LLKLYLTKQECLFLDVIGNYIYGNYLKIQNAGDINNLPFNCTNCSRYYHHYYNARAHNYCNYWT